LTLGIPDRQGERAWFYGRLSGRGASSSRLGICRPAAALISEAELSSPTGSPPVLGSKGRELKNQNLGRAEAISIHLTADGSLYLTLDDMLMWEAALAAGTLPAHPLPPRVGCGRLPG
jgi:hypothetical protein